VAKKNANGDGSRPRKRPDGRYEARYWIETTTGRKRRSVYGNTSKECAQKLPDAMAVKDDGPVFVVADIKVIEFFMQYEEVAKDTMKRRSFETCCDIARLHILPSLGNRKLKDLTREDVQRLYSRKRKGGLSAASVHRIHDVLSAALNTAVKCRLIEHNVCKEVSPPRIPAPEIRPFSKEEAKRLLLSAAESDRYHALYVLGVLRA
jgi:integrase